MLLRLRGGTFVALWLLVAASAGVRAQSPGRDFHFQTIGSEQGLAQNAVNAVVQDQAGYLWVGTQAGLQRYDGYAFRAFETGDDATASREAPVTALAEDADGTIWIGTGGAGLQRLGASSATIDRIADAAGSPPDIENVRAIAIDPGRGVWVGTDAGLARADDNGLRLEPSLALPRGEGRVARIRQLRRGDDGTLWIASSLGLFRLPAQGDALERVAADVLDDVATLVVDHAHRLYAGTYDGLYLIEGNAARRIWPEGGTHAVTAIAEDPRGRLWLAVPHEGLVALDAEHGEEIWLRPDRNVPGTLPGALITNLLVDRSGLLWVGTSERGLARMDPAGSVFRYVVDTEAKDPVAENNVRAIFEDATGGLWLGTDADGLKRYDPSTNAFDRYGDVIAHAFANAPSKHPDLRVAVQVKKNARAEATPAPLTDLRVTALAGTGAGRLWVATNHGMALFD
ncbi:MAG: two-component regulator propeller domain-containing protein, partial [Rhodanobacteraceae bacterium]